MLSAGWGLRLALGKLQSESSGEEGQRQTGVRLAGAIPSSGAVSVCKGEQDPPATYPLLLGTFLLFLPLCFWQRDERCSKTQPTLSCQLQRQETAASAITSGGGGAGGREGMEREPSFLSSARWPFGGFAS